MNCEVKRISASGHHTLCWDCDKAGGRCSWSKDFTPVPGWKATPTKISMPHYCHGKYYKNHIDSFHITECPEFEPMQRKLRRGKRYVIKR